MNLQPATILNIEKEYQPFFSPLMPQEIWGISQLNIGICATCKNEQADEGSADHVKPCGIAALQAKGNELDILYFFIAEKYRRQGYGHLLMSYIKEVAASIHSQRIRIMLFDQESHDFCSFLFRQGFDFGDVITPFCHMKVSDLLPKYTDKIISEKAIGDCKKASIKSLSQTNWSRFQHTHSKIAFKPQSYYSDGSFLLLDKAEKPQAGILLKQHENSITVEYIFNADSANRLLPLYLLQQVLISFKQSSAEEIASEATEKENATVISAEVAEKENATVISAEAAEKENTEVSDSEADTEKVDTRLSDIYFQALNPKIVSAANFLCNNRVKILGNQIDLLYFC